MDLSVYRKRMVEYQLMPRGIRDKRVLEAFLKVPRHAFVPDDYQNEAYDDHPLPIGDGQTISQPYIVALMTQELKLTGSEKVLEVGTGSGYQAAILAELAREVYTIDRIDSLAKKADSKLSGLGYKNVHAVTGDGSLGYEKEKPYDGIIVTCAAPSLPSGLADQLNDNGRIVIPVGPRFTQVLMVYQKKGDSMIQHEVCGCVFVPLIGERGWRQ